MTFFRLSYGQNIQKDIPFEEKIRLEIEDKSSSYFYPTLLNKIKTEPDKMTKEEIKHLYYGQIYKKGSGLAFMDNPNEDNFRKALAKNNCKKILSYGYSNLNDNPVQLTTLIPVNGCRQRSNEPDDFFLDLRIKILLEVILDTGNGKTKETAIKIANIEDDYVLKGILGFKGGTESIEMFENKPLSVWDNGEAKIYFEDCWNYKYR